MGNMVPLCVHKHRKIFVANAPLADSWKQASGETSKALREPTAKRALHEPIAKQVLREPTTTSREAKRASLSLLLA